MAVMLEGKVVIVTGGGSGLGRAYAQLAGRLGASVVVGDIDAERAAMTAGEIEADGGSATGVAVDVASWEASHELVEASVKRYGRLDGLVNNAGIMRPGRADELTGEDMHALLAVNVLGTAACSVHAARHMVAAGRGSIINVTSGAHVGLTGMAGYGASKGAVASLTYCWAADLQGTGVRVNAVSPWASTAMLDVQAAYLRESGITRDVKGYPAEANAPMVCYLLSDASAHVHGQIVRFDRGRLSLMAHPTVLVGSVQHEEWSVDDVAAAFRGQLDRLLQPLGIAKSHGALPAKSQPA
jgi:NAD(P)-dependent dehydrogenase (short-subunit alcohol dehydrogenase family)